MRRSWCHFLPSKAAATSSGVALPSSAPPQRFWAFEEAMRARFADDIACCQAQTDILLPAPSNRPCRAEQRSRVPGIGAVACRPDGQVFLPGLPPYELVGQRQTIMRSIGSVPPGQSAGSQVCIVTPFVISSTIFFSALRATPTIFASSGPISAKTVRLAPS